MDSDELGQKIKDLFSKGASASKQALEKAGDKVQDFTDKSVIKIEKKKIENKVEEKFTELGKIFYASLDSSANSTISDEDKSKIKSIQKEIKELTKEIKEKEDLLKNLS